jgi:hypothetical protein
MIYYDTSDAPEFKLAPAGTHRAFIDDVEIYNVPGGRDKLIVKFDLVELDGVKHNEFVTPSIMEGDGFRVFSDLLKLVNRLGVTTPAGELDEQIFVGLDCMVTIVHREGKGRHEGKTFANVIKIEPLIDNIDKKKQ